jgi:hypothetical protein
VGAQFAVEILLAGLPAAAKHVSSPFPVRRPAT